MSEALHNAARKGNLAALISFLDSNENKTIDLDLPNSWARTPLYLAARNCHEDMVRALIDRGAKVNFSTQKGTALDAAARWGHERIASILIEHGAKVNVDADKSNHDSALHVAAQFGHVRVAAVLIEHGAHLNRPGQYSDTPLECARYDDHKQVESLLENAMKRREHMRLISLAILLKPLGLPVLALYTVYRSILQYRAHPVARHHAWDVLKRLKQN